MANWRTYPQVSAADVVDADLLPYSDESAAVGSRTRTTTVGTLRAALSGFTTVVTLAGGSTLDVDDHLGAHVRVTPTGTITIPPDLPIGWACVIENATVSDDVTLTEGAGVTLLSAGVDVANGKVVGLVVVNTDVVLAVGAFADEEPDAAELGSGSATDGHVLTADGSGGAAWEAVGGGGDVVGPASVTDERIAVFDGATGKLLKEASVTVAGLATSAQGALADSAVQPADIADFAPATGFDAMIALTQAEYDLLTPDADTIYFIVDEP